jgi:hypothetical protein
LDTYIHELFSFHFVIGCAQAVHDNQCRCALALLCLDDHSVVICHIVGAVCVRSLQAFQLADLGSYLDRSEPPNWESLYNEIERMNLQNSTPSPFRRGFLDSLRSAAAQPHGQPTRLLLQRWGESAANPTVAELTDMLVKIDKADCVDALAWLKQLVPGTVQLSSSAAVRAHGARIAQDPRLLPRPHTCRYARGCTVVAWMKR